MSFEHTGAILGDPLPVGSAEREHVTYPWAGAGSAVAVAGVRDSSRQRGEGVSPAAAEWRSGSVLGP